MYILGPNYMWVTEDVFLFRYRCIRQSECPSGDTPRWLPYNQNCTWTIETKTQYETTISSKATASTTSPSHSKVGLYLKGTFRVEGNIDFNHFLVSNASGTKYVYIGAVDTIFQLHSDLTHVRNDSTDEIPYCSNSSPATDPCPLPTNENKILLYAPPPIDRLILCRNSDGHCEFRHISDISRDEGYIGIANAKQVASPRTTLGTYADGYLWVAASTRSSSINRRLPPISKRHLDQTEEATVFTFISKLPNVNFKITYLQEFIQGEFIYYLILHQPYFRPVISKLGRVCYTNEEYDLSAYTEITLTCGIFNKIQATHVSENDVLYAIFTDDTNSAICSYTMADIEERFVDATCGCASAYECHRLGQEIPYLQRDAYCSKQVSSNFCWLYQKPQKLSENWKCSNITDYYIIRICTSNIWNWINTTKAFYALKSWWCTQFAALLLAINNFCPPYASDLTYMFYSKTAPTLCGRNVCKHNVLVIKAKRQEPHHTELCTDSTISTVIVALQCESIWTQHFSIVQYLKFREYI